MKRNLNLTKKQIKLYKEYKVGDTISVSTKDYAYMFNKHKKIIKSSKRYSKEQVRADMAKGKFTRPVIVLWNNEHTNSMIVASMTGTEKEAVNYKLNIKSNINYEVLKLNKNKISISFNGKVFENHSIYEIEKFKRNFKNKRPKSYNRLVELTSLYSKIENDRIKNDNLEKDELIRRLLEENSKLKGE